MLETMVLWLLIALVLRYLGEFKEVVFYKEVKDRAIGCPTIRMAECN